MCTQLSIFPNFPYKIIHNNSPKIEEEEDNIEYPSSDGKPMSENTLHQRTLTYLKDSLDNLFRNDPTVFVAGDLSVYYVKGNSNKKIAPDVMVAFGNHKGDRGSYIIHRENDIPPTTTFEIVSPSNLKDKPDLFIRWYKYSKMQVKEYFVIHAVPKKGLRIESFKEVNGYLVPLLDFGKHTSECLGVEILFENGKFWVSEIDGERFNYYNEEVSLRKQAEEAKKQAEEAKKEESQKRKLAEEAKKEESQKRKLAEEQNQILKDNMAKQIQELEELRRLLALKTEEVEK